MPYAAATPAVNWFLYLAKKPAGPDSGIHTYFSYKGTIDLAQGRQAHLEYREEGPKFNASIFKPAPPGAGTDAPESSTRAGNGERPFNVIVLDAPRNFLQKVLDWLFRSLPFDGVLPLSERQAFAFNKLEREVLELYGHGAIPPDSEPEGRFGSVVDRIRGVAAAKQKIKDVRRAANNGQPASWRQVCTDLQNPLVADMVWLDPELLAKVANLCRSSESLLQLAVTFDPAGENPTPGLQHLIGMGGDMEPILERALFESCKDLSCADAIARLKLFSDIQATDGHRLFGRHPSSGHCKALRSLLLSKVSTPDDALQLAKLFPWDSHVAMKQIQASAGVQNRMRAHIDLTVTNALPPDFAKLEGEAVATFKRFIEVDLPSLFDPSATGRPTVTAWHLFQPRAIVNLSKAEERYHHDIDFTKLIAFFPVLQPAQAPAPATL